MDADALLLARIQFGFTISFHIIFPAITIGLASYLFVLEACWLKTGKPVFRDLYAYWLRIFAVNFAMGVVSGLVMAYQFGTNWSYFSQFAGGITGPLLAYEVLTAFFLEAGFLGVMLFGLKRVGPGLHLFATFMVALGTLISATWILASNSWMQTPAGFEIVGGRAVPVDWIAVILNPSFPYRLAHMSMAAFLATALMVAAAAGWHLLRGRDDPAVRKMMSMAMWMLLFAAPLQLAIGDLHGLNTLRHQPAKLAAIEGHWENEPGRAVPFTLVGWPDMRQEKNHFAVEIPHGGSLLLTHSWDGQFPGLKEFAPQDRPNATVVFWTFRLMVGLGLLMIALAAWGAWARWRGRLFESRALWRCALYMGPSGLVAMIAGWMTTEVGRQPWIVYGVMRTADGVSPHGAGELALTLALFVVVYFVLFGAGTVYMLQLIGRGPAPMAEPEGGPGEQRTPSRPLSAAGPAAAAPSEHG
ncbi:cytochrome ubiquinol oxidase subunit I [Parapusillimonas granuli]|uniref:Cytochrome ubiquinol oxidase subunit I n=1 Tax=Parapusillimonas granuli TaxID=380911 RepID=A0A853G1B0_9BURK|nr:cytochrome ubiquinol oxidase subunit I [Parapusillimonas granuli]MBB5217151.1 cytochrome d ubiquinol oxidase subunit I [Parapusillimonas granuli]MEB2401615.1 cytochrome ubiquinol oxidase subunit I [Alcaligenaceae bacterium]NYT50087.1 cytochrome ubiquinol oxidase subunit I [Parapusillimonas granuli]